MDSAKGLYETVAYSLFSINFACIKIREFRNFGKIAKLSERGNQHQKRGVPCQCSKTIIKVEKSCNYVIELFVYSVGHEISNIPNTYLYSYLQNRKIFHKQRRLSL